MEYTKSLDRLISVLKSLPGIGPRMAERLAFHILKISEQNVQVLTEALHDVKTNLKYCSICGSLTEDDVCRICKDGYRNHEIICVVEQPSDVFSIEKTREYKGLFHVLGGVISPLDGVNPDDLKINELITRIESGKVKELIIATNPNAEGEATAIYLSKFLKKYGVKISRIAHGVPVGSDLDYIDAITILKAIEGRNEI
jgi:recombination protein RecR